MNDDPDGKKAREQVARLLESKPCPSIQIQIDTAMARLRAEVPAPTLKQVRVLAAQLNYLEKRRHHEVIEDREERFRASISDSLERLVSEASS